MSRAAIILAAGQSTRLGQPKQLVQFEGMTFVQRAACSASRAGATPIVVITGSHHQQICDDLSAGNFETADWECVQNPQFADGMGTSIACGARHLTAGLNGGLAQLDSILILLCDQPLIPAAHLTTLMQTSEREDRIAATRYPDRTAGVPASFPSRYLSRLASLCGRQGAKQLIAVEHGATVPCPAAAFDIDEPADLKKIITGSPCNHH